MYWLHCWGVRSPAVAQMRSMAYWTFRFHSWVVPPASPLASVSPFELNDSDSTPHIGPTVSSPAGLGCAESAMSHSRMPHHTGQLTGEPQVGYRTVLALLVALAQDGDSVAVEFLPIGRAAGHGHDQCQGGAGHQWPGTGGEGAVGGRQLQAAG